ncbi:NAD(P)/FAD-dependent oxidoreductase [Paracoccus benzoatiresistens]|uniref:FAD-dependent oxidoreductase n=1 Tax=Paracoccus benzoatiresistens TaxID=2997341 RepID=A0ABT4J038_9RHOB|nr:FAD-dependent oxidoreductase [Paracoccus sp. EF6]MCZ0960486.1 FAD-dependent oxidoreductase [Paracoccus sp. EF6]
MAAARGRARALTSVTIIGGGIFGLACAWEMTRRGAPVRLFEARRIGAGSSGGHVGALAPHAPENWNPKKAFQLDSLLMAPAFWAGVEAASGLPTGYARTGRLQPVADAAAAERLQDRIAAAADRWPGDCAMRLTGAPAGGLVPDSRSGLWVFDGLTARLNPRAAGAALATATRSRGGEIIEGQQPATPTGPILWATGTAGLADLSRDLGRPIGKGVKGQSALLRHAAPDAPQVFADGLHIVPHADGTVAIGSTSENDYDHLDTDDQIDALIARARSICPQLRDAPVIDRWAGERPRARTRAPILGRWPGRPGHYVANGGFKIGFGMAPGIAQVIADLILDGQDAIPDGFRL